VLAAGAVLGVEKIAKVCSRRCLGHLRIIKAELRWKWGMYPICAVGLRYAT
jgi:hypothetical protein